MPRDARGTGARGVMGSEKAREKDFSPFPFPSPLAITPRASVPRAWCDMHMKTAGDESVNEVNIFMYNFPRLEQVYRCGREF